MSAERESGVESPEERFEREVVEPTRKAMEEAMAQAISEEDVEERIREALPEGRSFLGPMIFYREDTEGAHKVRRIQAMVQTLDRRNRPVDIEARFEG